MKLTTVLLIATIMQVSATGFAQRLTLNENNVTIKGVFKEIKKQTGFDVLYQLGTVKDSKRINARFSDASLQDVLKQCLEGQSLEFTIDDKTVVIKEKEPSFLDKVKDRFFDISVSGVVLDSAGKPLPGASVTVKGTLKAVTTGDAGQFYLKDVKEGSILVISFVGYQMQEVEAKQNTFIQIRMAASANKLQEVIVNAGYYTVKESERTGSISRITSKEIEKQPVTNILAAMQGRMAGVNIVQQNGMPGGGFAIEIRGKNNLSRNSNNTPINDDPLYIIDGMPYSTQRMDAPSTSASTFGNYGPSPLNGINPTDIESLEVLKDADATAIYGSRGANGVVIITTKKGKVGKTLFSMNAYTGASRVTHTLDLMNTQQYLEMRKEAYKNDGVSTIPSWANDLTMWDQNRYTDWQKELIGGTALTDNIYGQVSGGNGNTQFLMSGAYNKQGVIMPGKFAYTKGTAHFNVNHKSENQRFSLGLSGNYVADKNNLPGVDLTNAAINLAPNAPVLYNENGDLNWENSTWDNPLAKLEQKYLGKTNTLNASSILNYKILPGLDLKTTIGFMDARLIEALTIPHTIYDPSFGLTSNTISLLYLTNSKQQSWNIEPQLTFQQTIGKGLLNVLVGTTFMEKSYAQLVNSGQGFTSDNLISNLSAATTQRVLNNINTEYRYNAVFGRLNYNWSEKYIINLTARRDGSSRFGPGRQFGNFGAFGAAWLFGKEEFINKTIPFLSSGKLRTSYGITGSDQIPEYGFLNTYSILTGANNNYQGIVGLSPTQLYNPNFSWGTTKKLEMALDMGFLNDKILYTIAFFKHRSSNQLVGIPLPGTTAFSSIQANLDATVQNTGWEFELRTENFNGKEFHWSTSLNLTALRNKLISYPGLAGSTYAQFYEIGKPLNIQKLYHYTGINTTTGVYTFQDFNGGGISSDNSDRQSIVDLTPKYQGGITNRLSYNNFELEFLFSFVKQKGLDYTSNFGLPGLVNANQPVDLLNRWQITGDKRTYQKYSALAGSDLDAYYAYSNYQLSDGIVSDASYIRLKNLSIAYTFPKSLLKVVNCRIYLQGQNLLTITNYKGLDPETQFNFRLPTLRVITAGLQLNF